jgi:HEPN domain-containing protein
MTAPAAFEIWLQRAKSNLKIARMGKREGVFLEDLCFEAQQAAEKALKALLIYRGADYPRTHSFALLLTHLAPLQDIPDAIQEVIALSDYAVQIRYPGDYHPVSEEEYQDAVALATQVLNWVADQLAPPREEMPEDATGSAPK